MDNHPIKPRGKDERVQIRCQHHCQLGRQMLDVKALDPSLLVHYEVGAEARGWSREDFAGKGCNPARSSKLAPGGSRTGNLNWRSGPYVTMP